MASIKKSKLKKALETIGHFQYLVIVTVLYLVLTFPIAMVMKLKKLRGTRQKSTYWVAKKLPEYTVENYREQGNPQA